jgi:hypothetical protein
MGGLADSRHAPRPTQDGIAPSPALTVNPAPIGYTDIKHIYSHPSRPAGSATANSTDTSRRPPSSAPHELARYKKIIRRLQWKLPFLAQGYRLAVDRVGADPAAVSEAELMFKLDFFEYYMLIERALVHLLGVFGVEIPRGYASHTTTTHSHEKDNKGLAGSVWRDGNGEKATHRYHANVLAALDWEGNPLHGTLGKGEVRVQLGRAKDLRNRWKTAGDDEHNQHHHHEPRNGRSPTRMQDGTSPEREWRTRKVAAPLDSYRLEHMLEVIFQGFDEAYSIAEAYVKGGRLEWGAEPDTDMLEVPDWADAGDDEDQWDFMVEAMDWEAV